MKKFAYFPGCSLEKIALSYHESALESTRKLGVELQELEDWNCCGATTYNQVDQALAYTIVARNLAMAEKEGLDLVAPCSACYKNSYFTNADIQENPDLLEKINLSLQEDNLELKGELEVRHLIEVFHEDIGEEAIAEQVVQPLTDLKVAPYYGCQIVRPRKDGENIENPQFFEEVLAALGAEPVEYPEKMRCCSASLIMTGRKAALDMVRILLYSARKAEADVIATACPLCQVNLECYQGQVNEAFGTDFHIPVLYFTQLAGLALGINPNKLGLGAELVSAMPVLSPFLEKEAS